MSVVDLFEFCCGRVVFGRGALSQVGATAKSYGTTALVVRSPFPSPHKLFGVLDAAGVSHVEFVISTEPTLDMVSRCLQVARDNHVLVLVGFGGGSAMDTAKAVSALLTNGGDLLDYLEVIGKGKPLTKPGMPCIAIPTTAGTGAEVTKNAVLCSPSHSVKVSLRSNALLPAVSVVDPELTVSMPPDVTAATGMDALTQCIEPFVCNKPNPITDALCREGIKRAARALEVVWREPTNMAAREDMCVASLIGGLALANAKLGAVHGFAGPLGGMLEHAAHGALCGCLLPHVVAANIDALEALPADDKVATTYIPRFKELAQLLTQNPTANIRDSIPWLRRLASTIRVPTLSQLGLSESSILAVLPKAVAASSMKGNPVVLPETVLAKILHAAM
eukprot:TRINITY_DN4137_c0_g1_i1.p1 TRINITY_DN4137_c0_g1~~TRINITY_DN4137_c0_g1_i1.p1  ORF type:complete len:410 (-),score=80.65 TRINITY_DN4137_c0_g1_i1:159-1334(-)